MSTALTLRPQLQQQLPASLSPQIRQAAALLLSQQPPANTLTSVELRQALYKPISAVAMLLGHSNSLTDAKDLKVMGTALAAVVHRRFPAFTLAEVSEALIRGASGDWLQPGVLLLPNLPNFTHWLQSYQQSIRAEALAALQAVAAAEQRQLPPPVQEQELPAAVAQLAEQVRTVGYFPEPLDAGSIAYNWLKRIGAFRGFKTPEQYADMMRKESIKLAQRVPFDKGERKQVRAFGQLLRQGWPAGHPLAVTVTTACQKRLLREWIRYHVARKTDLCTWLTRLAEQQRRLTPSPNHPVTTSLTQ